MATASLGTLIQTRALSSTGDPLRGAGLQNFVTNLDATAEIILTTVRLLQNEVFYNLNIGTPLFGVLLDHPTTTAAVTLIMRNIILACPFVTGISSIECSYGAGGRTLTFSAVVTTQFGPVTVGLNQ